MRWGVPSDSTDKHTTVRRCLREINGCKKYSIGPNFVVKHSGLVSNNCSESNKSLRTIATL